MQEEAPRITLAEGVILPAVSAITWLEPEIPAGGGASPGAAAASSAGAFPLGERFATSSADGAVRIWELSSGKLERAFPAGSGEAEALSFPEAGSGASLAAMSPDGNKKLFLAEDGAVCLAEAATEKVLAKYYALEGGEWLSVVPEGFYNASFGAAPRFIAETEKRRYSLARLSGALFRPDLFEGCVLEAFRPTPREDEEDAALPQFSPPQNLRTLFGKGFAPPELFLSPEEGGGNRLKIKVSPQDGGTGFLALYRRSGSAENGADIPAGLRDPEKTGEAGTDDPSFEIIVTLNPGETGFSVFNEHNTIESERVWITLPDAPQESGVPLSGEDLPETRPARESPATQSEERPALKALLAAGDGGEREHIDALGELFSSHAETALYSAAEVKKLFDEDFSRAGFVQSCGGLFAGAKENDVHVVYLRGGGRADSLGNLHITRLDAKDGIPENEIAGTDLLQSLLGTPANLLVILDLRPSPPDDPRSQKALEAALRRFRERLGPKAMLGVFAGEEAGFSAARALTQKLDPVFLDAAVPEVFEKRYVSAAELLEHAAEALAERGQGFEVFFPPQNFDIADSLVNSGELKFQTMTSGMLKIDQVDKTPVPLVFGETMSRALPAGNYIIDMIYRNGYRETRTLEARKRTSAWVIFTYTPPLLVGDFSAALSRIGGINVSELNPANYRKINREAMESMGMAPYYVAFLAGEKFYREGDYEKALAEYSRALSLKPDYADAYVSRGNAHRRKGELDRAIEDYNRALSLNPGYAEVYNYRGFVYAAKGDLNLAAADYTNAIRYRADYTDAYFNRAHAYARQRKWDLSIADYTQVIKLEPSNAAAYNGRAGAYRGKGDESAAASDYAAAERLKPR